MKKKPVVKVRLQDRRRRESYISYGVYVLIIVCALGGIAYTTRLSQFLVSEVRVEGATHAPKDAIVAEVEKVLDGTYALLVPKNMMYVVPRGVVVERVVTTFPIVESATVTRAGRTLVVTIVERTPAALYCTDTCYRMDAYGFIFDTEHGDTLPRYRGGTHAVGGTYLDGAFHDLELSVRTLGTIIGRDIVDVSVDGSGDVFARTADQGELRFRMDADAVKLTNDVRAIFASPLLAGGAPFEYVELRFGTKAAVKMKE
jgi:hypothetical protein